MTVVYQVMKVSNSNDCCDSRDRVVIEYDSRKEAVEFIKYKVIYADHSVSYYIRKVYSK